MRDGTDEIESFNHKVSRKISEAFSLNITEQPLSFFIDAYFDKRNQKWFWSNKNEIQADQWAYKCSNLPHQPATDLVVTIKVAGNLHMPKQKKSSTDALQRGMFRQKSTNLATS